MQRVLKTHLPTIISLLAATVLLAVTLTWFYTSQTSLSLENESSKLKSNAQSLASAVSIYLDDHISMLADKASEIAVIDDDAAEEKALSSIKAVSGFVSVGIADASGETRNMSGGSDGNIAATRLFENGMKGKTFADLIIADKKMLMLEAPIMRNGKISGIIYGVADMNALSGLFVLESVLSPGTDILVSEDGKIIAMSPAATPELARINDLFSEVEGVNDKDSLTTCVIGEKEYIIALSPIEKYGMYGVSAASASRLRKQDSALSADTMILIFLVSFAFIVPVIAVVYLLKNSEDLRRTGERFRLVTVVSQDMVFDYDYQKQLLTLDGNTDNITPDDKKVFTRAEALRLVDRVHDEDKDIKTRVLDIAANTETSIKGEFRIRCLDDTFRWFRVKGAVVRGHDGAAQRIIGSLINVDEHTAANSVPKDELDPITGILNKRSFYTRVNDMMKDASDSDLFAMYIIDLDSFNSVNDKLGHSIGDSILSDVAKKLCVVFSDKDIVGRTGGDEFAAFLHLSSNARSVGMSIIENKAQAICTNMNESYDSQNGTVRVTASVGVSIYPYCGRDYNTLFRNADKALGKVKESGKNRYCIYSPDNDK